jgi:nicotinate-nucleotide adenylyltransferase
MIQKSKIGIFGGTFSPPHFGHIYAAEVFLKEANLDKLLIMPTFIPPHKQLQDDHPLLRMEMVQLAFQDCFEYGKRLLVDPYEISRQQKSYTYQTLIHFADPTKELYFLCGTDMFLTLPHWRRPDIICDLAVITLMRREENPEKEEERNFFKSNFMPKHFV